MGKTLPGQSTLWGSTPPGKEPAQSPSSCSAGKEARKQPKQQSLWPALQVHSVESNSEGENAVSEGKSGCKERCEQLVVQGEGKDWQEQHQGGTEEGQEQHKGEDKGNRDKKRSTAEVDKEAKKVNNGKKSCSKKKGNKGKTRRQSWNCSKRNHHVHSTWPQDTKTPLLAVNAVRK